MMNFIQPEKYQSEAESTFLKLKDMIFINLPWAKIEHIGSSAIKGAISKGDLDVFVGVPGNKFEESLRLLKSLDFQIKQDTLRNSSLCMLETQSYDMDTAIQLVELGSSFENFLIFRDKLNLRSDLVASYNLMKENCTGKAEEEYRAIKSIFIQKVLSQ